jgi:alkanesulfonate monooxygenase SsuD/methylene tetrahydromethanopterin reductase-like flavin-dependent oxidoreductase (luciferase family)
MLRRDVVDFPGDVYDVPRQATGRRARHPLKMMMRPLRGAIPTHLTAIGPKKSRWRRDRDGWLPIFVSPSASVTSSRSTAPRRDSGSCRRRRGADEGPRGRPGSSHHLALYVGGMGARGKNFYNDLVCRYGYEAEAAHIQDLYLGGKKLEAAVAVPDALVDEVALVGSREEIADRLDAWRECGVTTLIVQSRDLDTLRAMAELAL